MGVGDNFKAGQIEVDVSDTAQQVAGIPANSASLALKNHPDSTGPIYLGHNDDLDDESGWPLSPGEAIGVDVLTANKLWIYGTAADRLCWVTVSP